MTRYRRVLIPALVVVVWAAAAAAVPASRIATDPLPAKLTDQEYWNLIEKCSEPDGYFQSDNLVSNEHTFQYVVPSLKKATRPGGVYLGVAPDQNFTYMLAVAPKMAFIVDIRRGNLHTQLMYKAVFELSADRAEFVSRLFSKKRPAGLDAKSSAQDIFAAYLSVRTDDDAVYQGNLKAIKEHLTKKHGFGLSGDDLRGIEYVYWNFYWYGPSIIYSSKQGGGSMFNSSYPSYADLMVANDGQGQNRSYLANEENFRFMKDFEEKNLLVPIVGDFAGPKALRAVGQYIRDHGAVISAFYTSNVEQYLFQNGVYRGFYENVATLPVDEMSTIIRSVSSRYGYQGTMLAADGRGSALDPIAALVKDFQAGKIASYYDVNARSK